MFRRVMIPLALISLNAWAITGKYADSSKELPSSCKLSFQVWDATQKKVMKGSCSSSYLGNNTLITSEHCLKSVSKSFGDLENKTITETPFYQCPGLEEKYPVIQRAGLSESGVDYQQDLALMRVKGKVSVPEINLPRDSSEIEKLFETPEKCFINGFGIDNEGKHGKLRAAQMTDLDNKVIRPNGTSSKRMARIRGNLGGHGDSGGPLFCITDRGPVLVGVIEGGHRGVAYTDIEKINDSMDWIEFQKNSKDLSNETFRAFTKLNQTCSSIFECFGKMDEAYKLSKNIQMIISKFDQDMKVISLQMRKGEIQNRDSIDALWKVMIETWEKEGCYDRLYP